MGLLQNLTGWHALILLAVVLLFFGASKLPALAKSLGQSARILKTEARDAAESRDASASDDTAATVAVTAPVAGPVDAPAPADRH